MFCDGFYGKSFGEPVCSTCHMFLFSSDINKQEGEEEVYTEVILVENNLIRTVQSTQQILRFPRCHRGQI